MASTYQPNEAADNSYRNPVGTATHNAAHHGSGVSWGAIFAGALGAAALSLLLIILGAGLGLSSVSAWSQQGADAGTIGWSTIGWITFTQLASAGVGGYLAGRLRTRWLGTHTDEVYFRDTAHGFLAWALATLVTVVFLSSAITGVVSGSAKAVASVASGAASAVGGAASAATSGAAGAMASRGGDDGGGSYWIDSLFRTDPSQPRSDGVPQNVQNAAQTTREVARIFANSIQTGQLSEDDSRYVAQLIAQRTGISQEDAQKRVQAAFDKTQEKIKQAEVAAREAAEKARKASAYTLLWLFVSLLVGAFVASLLATLGGRRRDA